MWPITVVLSVPAILALVVLAAEQVSNHRNSERHPSLVDKTLQRCERASHIPAVRWVSASAVVFYVGLAVVNFFASNKLSWGLALNWAVGLAIITGLGRTLWLGWRRLDSSEWKVVRSVAITSIGLVWLALVVLTTAVPGSGNDYNAIEAAVLVTMFAWVWVPIIGLPIGLTAGLAAAFARRRTRRTAALAL